ncbi:MAG: Mrp/NBP35 family ATP-binding protein [Methanomicrobiales archaeon]|nr:Mrp/NBP35 family ATP-binding protein [Methanomicrobiales archaeon]MDI6875189.1 Mrp/NBP35 family ATP-binding protein [Methanomicrobiales archaeon]
MVKNSSNTGRKNPENAAEQKQNPGAEECPGTCETCPHAQGCPPEQKRAVQAGMPEKARISVRHVILVLSGKGGVGKSTVSVNLATALANHGYKVGLADLDIHGPNIPSMLGVEGQQLGILGNKIEPVRVTGNLSVISMAFLLPKKETPIIWRGPMKMSAIRQFLEDVDWGDLDYLVVDLPPGTGDEALSIIQLAPHITGAVIVTTPQDVATLDARKAVKFIEKLDLRVLGIVENMSGMVCPHCGEEIDLFGSGGGKKAAEELGVPFLGAIPVDPEMRKAADEGRPFIIRRGTDNPTWTAVDQVMENLIKVVEGE